MNELVDPDSDPDPDEELDPTNVGLFDAATDHTGRLDDVTDISPDGVDAHVTEAELFAVCPTCGGLRLRDETDEESLPRAVPLRPDRILTPVCMGCYDAFQKRRYRDGYTKEEAADAIDHRRNGPPPMREWAAGSNGGDGA
ncbi:hypothetical protein [Haloarcula sp. H-GB5]